MNILDTLLEATGEKKVVMAFGRMNPPTAGHAKLVDKVKSVAKSEGADHSIRLSHSQDSKKNPLSSEQKLTHAQRMFPGTNLSSSHSGSPSYLSHAAELHKKGYKHLVMVAGEDRAKQYHDTLHQYNGKFDAQGNGFHFKSIKVVSAGHRDPDAEGTEGISASKMREHAKTGNFKDFHKGLPKGTAAAHAQALFHDVRAGMKLKEEQERDAYVRGEIFNKGDLVEDLTTGEVCPVEFRGDNYVTILTMEGNIVKRFIKDITMADKDLNEDFYLNRWAKQKASDNRANAKLDRDIAKLNAPPKSLADRAVAKVPVDHAKVARHIEHAWGNSFPDGDPYDHLSRQYPSLHSQGTLYKHLNTATKKHLGAKSFSHYLAQGWDDYHADNKNNPDSMTHGQKNPWKEEAELEATGELNEGLPRSAVKLLQRSDRITKDPDMSKPYKVAASHILQGDFHGLKAHLKTAGADISNHVINSLQQYGGEEGRAFAKHVAMEETELTEWKVGDIVKPTVGPHAHAPHTIIHAHDDGSYNIKPNLPGKMVKYRQGAVKARPDQLQKYHTEEVVDEGWNRHLDQKARDEIEHITPMTVYSFNHPKATKDTPVAVTSHAWDKHNVGDTMVVSAGAPGRGEKHYQITRKDQTGLYGRAVKNTIRSEEVEQVMAEWLEEDRRMSDSQKANRERYVKSMKKHLGDFRKRYGKKAEKVMNATATKMAMGEDSEQQDESFMVYAASAKALSNKQKAAKAAKTKAKNIKVNIPADKIPDSAWVKPPKYKSKVKEEVETKYEEPKIQYQSYEVTLDEVAKEILIPLNSVKEFDVCMESVDSTEEVQSLVSRLNGIIQ